MSLALAVMGRQLCDKSVRGRVTVSDSKMRESSSSSFDPYSWRNFYFHVDREEATRLLCQPDSDLGTFLIRDSTTPGSYALSVRY